MEHSSSICCNVVVMNCVCKLKQVAISYPTAQISFALLVLFNFASLRFIRKFLRFLHIYTSLVATFFLQFFYLFCTFFHCLWVVVVSVIHMHVQIFLKTLAKKFKFLWVYRWYIFLRIGISHESLNKKVIKLKCWCICGLAYLQEVFSVEQFILSTTLRFTKKRNHWRSVANFELGR